ncbi:gliding motility-associated C-terminal domain-containing protein [Hymenobacter rubidus]|uniref:gliding motility-associated C-terminal domain-containing protein n=1 Tax=Hymenobacter rubidus TaxID=1441626 RepID=UPI00191EF79E|nr:gliding motility-associated C-terminal domain-containing protein [Hymenobacter rubidus]
MRKILQSFTLLLAMCCLWGGVPAALASHIQGGQMTYRYVSGDTYEVTVSFYRDCTGATLPTTAISITAQQTCNGTSVTGSLSPVAGSLTTGIGYCPAIQALATCSTSQTTYPQYEKQDYRGTIILPPAANWIISYNDCCRPSTGNIPTQDNFRFEATLNNLVTVNGVPTRVNNTSPIFSSRDIPVPFVIVNQRTTINFTSALEPDGDSLVYSLDAPLSSCGVYNPYSPRVSGNCNPTQLSGAPGTICFLQCPAASTPNYTAELPMPVGGDTVGVCGTIAGTVYYKTVRPRFQLDATNGQITFTPNLYRAGSAALGLNKYVVVGKITEYRRLPGSNRRYRVGSVRRDFLVIVIDGSGNTVPATPVVTVPDPRSGAVPTNTIDTTRIRIQTCNYAQVRVNFTDPDNLTTPTHQAVTPLQNLTVTYTGNGTINFNQLQNGDIGTYQLVGDGTPNPQAIFYFQPGSSYAGQTIRIPLRIEDNACPIKGIQTRIIEITIVPGPFAIASGIAGASGIGNTRPGTATICPGGSLTLRGKVIRPDSIRRLATNTTQLQVYGYQWSILRGNGGGLPAVTTDSVITVNPTSTTRYRLNIYPTLGFAQGTCNDTTSILVRVVGEPVATATASLAQVCAGGAVLLTGSAARPNTDPATPVLRDVYTYKWTGPGLAAAGVVGPTLTVRPTTPGVNTYTLVANGADPYGCDATTTVQVTVVPPPVVTATRTLQKVCAGAPVQLTALASRPTGVGSTLNDTYTYAWSGPGITGANSTGATITVNPTTLGINTYTVTATGQTQFNCSNTQTVTVEVVAPPTVAVTTNNAYICPNGTATLTALATPAANFSDTYTYTWTTGGANGPVVGTGASIAVKPTTTTVYTVTAVGSVQTGCSVTGTVTVNVTPALVAGFTSSAALGANGQPTSKPPVSFTFVNTTDTKVTGQSPTATFTYVWTYQRIKDIANVDVSAPEVTFSTQQTPAPLKLEASGTYRIRLTATANVGGAACAATVKELQVVVPDIQVPNIITPNGDGFNDVFKISSAGTSSKVEIYNRWGRKVYEQANYQNNWGGDNQPAGVYYYLVTSSTGAQTKGWLEVVR